MTMTSLQEEEHYFWGRQCEGWHILKSKSLRITRERMPPGTSEIIHFHRFAQQVFYILSGTANFEINGEILNISKNKNIHINPKSLHRIYNNHQDDLHFLVISEPDTSDDRIEIIDFDDDLKEDIKNLNVEWLQKHFKVEEQDELELSNPKKEIIDKGGMIYFAKFEDLICGTISLMATVEKDVFELGKMAVTGHLQGMGIGQALLNHCFNVARQKNIKKLILYSNTKLTQAIHLYKKNNFTEVTMKSIHYDRANIKMEKIM